MDDRLNKALDAASYRKTLNVQKENIQARANVVSQFTYMGGSFTATTGLISFASTMANALAMQPTYVILDNNKRPIEITDAQDFLDTTLNAYNSAMNEYKAEFQKISRSRNINKLIGK